MLAYAYHPSPLGRLLLVGDDKGIQQLHLDEAHACPIPPDWRLDPEAFSDACLQLDEYFAGRRRAFELELAPAGTAFQKSVWRALCEIPFGQTESYSGVASLLGRPKAARAVGAACGANPIAIAIPCHRVIGQRGKLVGYAGGLDRKEALLKLEKGQ